MTESTRQPLRVLILEDSDSDAELVVDHLKQAGFDPAWDRAENEADFVAALDPDLDVILADFNLPSFSAPRALELIKERQLGVPLIVVSGSIGEDTAVQVLQSGAADYLLKDRLARLGSAVQRVVTEHRLQAEKQRAENERVRLMALTADVGLALNRRSDLGDCLSLCTESVVRHLEATFARIWTLNNRDSVLELKASSGIYTHIDGAHARIPVGQFKIGRIARDRRPTLTNEVVGDPEVHDQEWAKREGMVAFAGYPLVVDDQVVGVLALFARHRLSEAVLAALAAVADHIALGITRHQTDAERQLLASIVNDSDDAIISTTLDGVILSWNAGAEMLYGYPEAEAVGQSISLIIPPERSTELPEVLDTLRLGRHIRHHESLRRRKDGTDVPVSLTLSPIRDAAGQVIAASTIARDISERLRAQETLRLSEDRFRRLAETINEVFWIADPSIQAMVYVSPAYERIWGRTCESLYQDPRSFLEAIHPDDRQRVLEELSVQGAGLPFDHEYRIIQPDGEVRRIWDRGFPVLGPEGVHQYVGAAQDVTDRWHAEQARQVAEERMRFALEAAHVGVWEADLRTGVSHWSETCERIHGLPPGTFGRTFQAFLDRIHPDDRESSRHIMDRALREHRDIAFEYRTIHPNGIERRISATAHFSYDDAGVPVRGAGVSFDVTDRRSLEDQFRQAQKMEAVGQLAGGVAHDFNNVLTAILGYADFVLNDLSAEDSHRQDIDEIKKAGQRAAELTKQLLAFSRRQILAPRVLRLGDVVSAIMPMLRRLLGESIDLRSTMGDHSDVMADAGQMEQVLVNLAVNARDAMKDGGRLTIETADVVLDEAYSRQHPTAQPGPHVMLAVSDTGYGMDAATQARVFEPFFTTKPKGEGTGLGLASVYGIVKQSGGHVWVYSEVGRGTTFKVYLPRTQEIADVREPSLVNAGTPGGNETILVVEDEAGVRAIVDRVLSRYGYTVHAVSDPLRAIELTTAQDLQIDIILTDIVLPEMSGRALVQQLEQRYEHIKVLYMSGYTDNAIVHHGVLAPGMHFLQKPFTGEALAKKVREVLDGQ